MDVAFLGGASGVGASCLAVRFGATWVVIDAGVRTGSGDADRLPDLAMLEGRHVGAIFVTHAHADHIGALPLLIQSFPAVPIYASTPTIRLMEVMLADALRVMARRAVEELDIPLYDDELVRRTLRALRPLPLAAQVSIPTVPDLRVVAHHAGHIAGALGLSLVHPDGHLTVSGDVSMTAQRTITGAVLPSLAEPDLLVLESTYGARMHPNRRAEERRLAAAVASGIERGGHVLIPAFALGRAQEVLLVLREAQEHGDIPAFPIYADGLVRTVCNVYQTFPEALTPALQRRMARNEDVFLGGTVQAVQGAGQREAILRGEPACLIASSGMLTGGPSAWYASRLAERVDSSIYITGYQDEEAPGRALMDAAAGRRRTLEVGGRTVALRCTVATYALSAHADGAELAALAAALRPRQVALVHGDAAAREALRTRIGGTVHCPEDGDMLTIPTGPARRLTLPAPAVPNRLGIGQGLALTQERLPALVAAARAAVGTGAPVVTARALALLWNGATADDAAEDMVAALIAQPEAQTLLVPLAEVAGYYTLRSATAADAPVEPVRDPVEPGAVLLVELSSGSLLPFLCRERHGDQLRGLMPADRSEQARVSLPAVQLVLGRWPGAWDGFPRPLREKLTKLLLAAERTQTRLPPTMLARLLTPDRAYRFEEVCMLATATSMSDRLHIGRTLLTERTRFVVSGTPPEVQVRLVADFDHTHMNRTVETDGKRLIAAIERRFSGVKELYRRKIDPNTGTMTLSFAFPEVAQVRYATALAALAEETGATVELTPTPDYGALGQLARKLVPGCERPPKLHQGERRVRATTRAHLGPVEIQALQARFQAETAWTLEIQTETPQPNQKALRTELVAPQPTRMAPPVALTYARDVLDGIALQVGSHVATGHLIVQFALPQMEAAQHQARLEAITARTGWGFLLNPNPQPEALTAAFDAALPAGLARVAPLSIRHLELLVEGRCTPPPTPEQAEALAAVFAERTGWTARVRAAG